MWAARDKGEEIATRLLGGGHGVRFQKQEVKAGSADLWTMSFGGTRTPAHDLVAAEFAEAVGGEVSKDVSTFR